MNYSSNVSKLCGAAFFHHLIPAYVIERLFWQERGMNVLMVVFCEMIYAGTIVLAELPTGILADKIGRKPLMFVGAMLSFLEIVILLFAYNFSAFALAVFLAGIATACISGTANALLYDSLLVEKKEKSFEKIKGRINAYDLVAAILAALSGSLLGDVFNFEFNYIVSAGSMFIALGFTIFLKEPPRVKVKIETKTSQDSVIYIKAALNFFKQKPRILSMLIHAMAIAACITYLDEFWQLYLDEIGFPVVLFGVFSASIILVQIPGNLFAASLVHRFNTETILLGVLSITTIGLFLTSAFPGPIGILTIVIIFLVSGVIDPVITGYLHHRLSSEIRATVDSFQSLIERIISFVIGICFGYISTNLSLLNGFLFLGVVSFIFFVSLIIFKKETALKRN